MRDFYIRPASAASSSKPAAKPAWNSGVGGRPVSPIKASLKPVHGPTRFLPSPSKAPASLTNLKDVLARLAMPPPSRPNTSMEVRERAKDDIGMGLGLDKGATKARPNLGRSVTLGAKAFATPASVNPKSEALRSTTPSNASIASGSKPKEKSAVIPKLATLPKIPASPFIPATPRGTDYVIAVPMGDDDDSMEVDYSAPSVKGKEKAVDGVEPRGALSGPVTPRLMGMGPPPLPKTVSGPIPATTAKGVVTNAARSAPGAIERIRAASRSHAEAEGEDSSQVLKDCVIYVDVRTEGGEDAGGLFVDMLKEMGAKVGFVLIWLNILMFGVGSDPSGSNLHPHCL